MDIRAKETVLGHVGNITKYSDVKTNDVKIVQPDGNNLTTAKAGIPCSAGGLCRRAGRGSCKQSSRFL